LQPPLIPREALFERAAEEVILSPDGTRLAWIGRDDAGARRLYTQTAGAVDVGFVNLRNGVGKGIRFSADGRTLLFARYHRNERHLFGVNLATKQVRNYTPIEGSELSEFWIRSQRPAEVLAAVRSLEGKPRMLYRISLETGAIQRDDAELADDAAVLIGPDLTPRAKATISGSKLALRDLAREGARATPLVEGYPVDTGPLGPGVTPDGRSIYVRDRRGSQRSVLRRVDLASGTAETVLERPDADVRDVLLAPDGALLAVLLETDRAEWTAVDLAVRPDLAAMAALGGDEIAFDDPFTAGRKRLVKLSGPARPDRYAIWDTGAHTVTPALAVYPKLDPADLVPTLRVTIPARDGLNLPGYLTSPIGSVGPPPLVLLVEDVPWRGDAAQRFSPEVQFLANRGYAVLRVMHRGTAGFGPELERAGKGELGRKVLEDLVDGARWAVAERHADPRRMAVMGSGLGGYLAVESVARSPALFSCAVDWAGPTDFAAWFKGIYQNDLTARLAFESLAGDLSNPFQKNRLRDAMPSLHADRVKKPLLIGHGARDQEIVVKQSEVLVGKIAVAGGAASYAAYSEGGHELGGKDLLDWALRVEQFLGKCLGGRVEPPPAADYGADVLTREVVPERSGRQDGGSGEGKP
jgi:dipeptidyl aminopeptidase/acylaminoacyl peptidase